MQGYSIDSAGFLTRGSSQCGTQHLSTQARDKVGTGYERQSTVKLIGNDRLQILGSDYIRSDIYWRVLIVSFESGMLVWEKILIGQQAALRVDKQRQVFSHVESSDRTMDRPRRDGAYTWTEGTGHLLKGLRRRISIIHTAWTLILKLFISWISKHDEEKLWLARIGASLQGSLLEY